MPSSWSKKYFLGAKSKEEASILCASRDICLYYRMECPEDVGLPLMLVYRDCKDRVFHLPVERRGGRWQLAWDDSVQTKSLPHLLDYYQTMLLAHKGHRECFESFPVWTREFQSQFRG